MADKTKVFARETATRPEGACRQPCGVPGGVASAILRNALPTEAETEIERLVADLAAACGPQGPRAEQKAILHSMRVSRGGRGYRRAIDQLQTVGNSLLRHLKRLDLGRTPKPRTLSEVFAAKVAPSGPILAAKPAISV